LVGKVAVCGYGGQPGGLLSSSSIVFLCRSAQKTMSIGFLPQSHLVKKVSGVDANVFLEWLFF
jgi:hypothetical protein